MARYRRSSTTNALALRADGIGLCAAHGGTPLLSPGSVYSMVLSQSPSAAHEGGSAVPSGSPKGMALKK